MRFLKRPGKTAKKENFSYFSRHLFGKDVRVYASIHPLTYISREYRKSRYTSALPHNPFRSLLTFLHWYWQRTAAVQNRKWKQASPSMCFYVKTRLSFAIYLAPDVRGFNLSYRSSLLTHRLSSPTVTGAERVSSDPEKIY